MVESLTVPLDPSEASPAAPILEFPTIVLFGVGLLTLTGYVLWKKRI
jgi:LPXTG-motif cell wall-anchored protein